MAVVMTAHLLNPFRNTFSAGTNALVANTSILGEWALRPDWAHPDSLFITLEQQPVARPNTQRAANLERYGNLTFAGDFCLFLQ